MEGGKRSVMGSGSRVLVAVVARERRIVNLVKAFLQMADPRVLSTGGNTPTTPHFLCTTAAPGSARLNRGRRKRMKTGAGAR